MQQLTLVINSKTLYGPKTEWESYSITTATICSSSYNNTPVELKVL